jgi:hypothetical protein
MMKNLAIVILALFYCGIIGAYEKAQSLQLSEAIGPGAVWDSDELSQNKLHEECGSLRGPVDRCFISFMERSGASPQAVAFANLVDKRGYLRGFRKAGPVDIAYAAYPFKANENYGYLLVNGDPTMIDVDNLNALPKKQLESDPTYLKLAAKFPKIAIWPGDRFSTEYPIMERLPEGGQRFVVEYRLTDFCHACEVVGKAKFGFDFDSKGKFLGIKALQVE